MHSPRPNKTIRTVIDEKLPNFSKRVHPLTQLWSLRYLLTCFMFSKTLGAVIKDGRWIVISRMPWCKKLGLIQKKFLPFTNQLALESQINLSSSLESTSPLPPSSTYKIVRIALQSIALLDPSVLGFSFVLHGMTKLKEHSKEICSNQSDCILQS